MILSKVSHSVHDFWENEFIMPRNRRRIIGRILKCIIGCGLIFIAVQLIVFLIGDETKPIPESEDLRKLMVRW